MEVFLQSNQSIYSCAFVLLIESRSSNFIINIKFLVNNCVLTLHTSENSKLSGSEKKENINNYLTRIKYDV